MSASWGKLFFQLVLLLASCGHINTKTPSPTSPSLDPISPLPSDIRRVVLKGESHTEKVELLNPVDLALECIWSGNENKSPNITGYWRKDGEEMQSIRVTVQLENDKYTLRQVFKIVSKENLGSYSCSFGDEAKADFLLAGPQIGEVRDKPIVSYVGDSVVVKCKMDEKKPKPASWNWYKANGTDKEQIFYAAEPQKYEIKNHEWVTKLVVHKLTEGDSGFYYCEGVYAVSTTMGHVELKVITFLEPLKPFIAIIVEVIVLVAAILIYEKSQSKKNSAGGNETNADQTNTPTPGDNNGPEESSSTRQRKV
ncbi:embigin [Solea senegalensis]|uniref:Embigin n=2 Tax=Solea senegalensis TaxID=28829 RepID=A0AAV6QDJ2_SOLSE|nr:embigin-like [Solea senegalensis]XP_043883020.1 embigin-like [Solea senegalensis]KAG7489217.1 embigin [Solea senegalensis]KAG7489908.1 embigin [Solea senegalensis]